MPRGLYLSELSPLGHGDRGVLHNLWCGALLKICSYVFLLSKARNSRERGLRSKCRNGGVEQSGSHTKQKRDEPKKLRDEPKKLRDFALQAVDHTKITLGR